MMNSSGNNSTFHFSIQDDHTSLWLKTNSKTTDEGLVKQAVSSVQAASQSCADSMIPNKKNKSQFVFIFLLKKRKKAKGEICGSRQLIERIPR